MAYRNLLLLLLCSLFTVGQLTAADAPSGQPIALTTFVVPFGFAYQDWKDKLQAADGGVLFKELSSKGGAGRNLSADYSAYANRVPALWVQVRPGNTAPALQLLIVDTDNRGSRWSLPLPAPSTERVLLLPAGMATFSAPTGRQDGKSQDNPVPMDLAKIQQFQVCGDWGNGVVDVVLHGLVAVDSAHPGDQAAISAALDARSTKDRLAQKHESLINSYSHVTERTPTITHVALAAPDIIALTVEAQRITPSTVTPYVPQPGDTIEQTKWSDGGANNGVRSAKLLRNGNFIGTLQGPKLDHLTTYEGGDGDPFLDFAADDVENYALTSSDDPAYASARHPQSVARKTLPTDAQLPGGVYPTRHTLFLRLAAPLVQGRTYTITTSRMNVQNPVQTLKVDATSVRSDSVHVNQNGYRPDDPYKRATLSLWLGTAGGYAFTLPLRFQVIDEQTKAAVYSGQVEQALALDGTEQFWTVPAKNYAQTAVYRMDFAAVTTPGTYRVAVDGIGCSYPFQIQPTVWEHAFQVQMKGLYNNRSGIAIGPPYSDFTKPRDFHPDDGAVVTRSTFDVQAKGMYDTSAIPAGDTKEPITTAWGGYHDAGDWNPRRVSHMLTTFVQLELLELSPTYFAELKLNIPPTSGPGLPDTLTEALWEIDCFRRIQQADGAMPYGIESQTDPMSGEISWLSTQHLYVLAPTLRDSWLYAAVAGRAAKLLRQCKPELAKTYEDSAVRAFAWAEAEFARKTADKSIDKVQDRWMAEDARNSSALVLYDLTSDHAYHDVFVATTCLTTPGKELCSWGDHIQTDAAFLYARLDDTRADAVLKRNAIAAVLKLGDDSLAYAAKNAFNVTCREKGRPMFAGFFSVSGGMEVARAHFLSGKPEYLAGAVQSCQFSTGCNPGNRVYTTGLGSNPIRHPLHLDSRSTGQEPPVGITVFGPADIWNFRGSFWDINMQFVNKPDHVWPDAYSWPLTEAYYDTWLQVSSNEFVIDTWQQNVFVWGYLAARK